MFDVEPTNESGGHCDCCGNQTRTVWGFVHKGDETVASYVVQWTVGKSIEDHPANFDIILGGWGEGSRNHDRRAISMIHFENADGPQVSVIDAADRPIGASELIGSALKRSEVIGTPLAQQAFAIFDAVIVQDKRLA
ncbi:MAG: hypothetical protein AAF687_14120 [Pseudomonadota bacterium]